MYLNSQIQYVSDIFAWWKVNEKAPFHCNAGHLLINSVNAKKEKKQQTAISFRIPLEQGDFFLEQKKDTKQ